MNPTIVICVVLAALALADAKKCELKKAGLRGDSIRQFEAGNSSKCKQACLDNDRCMASTYNKKTKSCTLHSDVKPANIFNDASTRVFGKECVDGVPVRIQTTQCMANARRVGDQCVCNSGFELQNGICQAIVVCPANGRRVGNSCVCNQGFNMVNEQCQVIDPFQSTFCVTENINCPHNDIVHHSGIANIRACQLLCDQNSLCQGAQFRGDGNCWLKRSACPNPVGENGIHISLKIAKGGNCASYQFNHFCVYNNRNCPFHDITKIDRQNMQQCQQHCRNTPGCIGLVHNSAQQCWLKRACGVRIPALFAAVALRSNGQC